MTLKGAAQIQVERGLYSVTKIDFLVISFCESEEESIAEAIFSMREGLLIGRLNLKL
jgi:hypothetical protein